MTTEVSGRYFSFRWESDGDIRLSLGNLTDAGWYWDGDGSDLAGFLWRLAHSQTGEEFIKQMNSEGLEYSDLKPMVLPMVDTDLYMYSGDNAMWRFGGDEIDFIYLLEDFQQQHGLSDSDMEKVADESFMHYAWDFDEFAETDEANEILTMVRKAFTDSDTFSELFDELNGEDIMLTVIQNTNFYRERKYQDALLDAKNELKL